MEHIEANIECIVEYGSLSIKEMVENIVYSIKNNYTIEKSKVFPKLDKDERIKIHFMCQKTAIHFKIDTKTKKMAFLLLSLVGDEEESNRSRNFNDMLESRLDVDTYHARFF